jgi:hypothetical protein
LSRSHAIFLRNASTYRRLEKNRAAAALSRSRKKDLVCTLQQRVSILEQANVSMSHALAILQAVRIFALPVKK